MHKFHIASPSNPYLDVHCKNEKLTVKMPEKFLLTEDLSAEYISKLQLLLTEGW